MFLMTDLKGFVLISKVIIKIYTINLSFLKNNVFLKKIMLELSEIPQIFFELNTLRILRV